MSNLRRVVASAPSQAFLFGEHAVLYGSPALALGVDVRSYAEVTLLGEEGLEITSELGRYARKGDKVIIPNEELEKLDEGIKKLLQMLNENAGLRLNIRSNIPVGSGMASSASVAASISKAVSHLLGHELSDQELLEAVYIFERIIHGKASKTGPACAVFGGVIWVEWSGDGMSAQRLTFKDLPLVMACTDKPSRTKEMIEKVAKLRDMIPEQFDHVISAIKGLVHEGRRALLEGDLERLGSLMNFNQGLLYALGVSSSELEELIWLSRENGALGAKISGAGGGGCVVILHEDPDSLVRALSSRAKRYFVAKVSNEGARIEDEV